MNWPGAHRLAGAFLVVAGAAVLAVALAGYAEGPAWQLARSGRDSSGRPSANPIPPVRPGEAFARLRIPRISLDLTVIEGTRKRDLLKAPGHLSGSGAPGEPDNCVIAGHRDLHFRRLGQLHSGDFIELEAGGRKVGYRVESVGVVSPSRTDLLGPTPESLLTLVTCYPFNYVGPAPDRFVVRARREADSRAPL